MSQRKKQTPLTPFLLTYQDYTPSYRDVVPTNTSYQNPETQYAPFSEPVWQTALRIFQHRPSDAPQKDCPETLDWPAVACVDVLSHKANSCPICLEHVFKCPRITKCGHVYCFPCIARYIEIRKADDAATTCPMCFEPLVLNELKAVRIQRSVSSINAGIFVLTLRHKNTNVVRLADGNCHNYFQKLHYIEPSHVELNEDVCPGHLFLTPEMYLTNQFFHIYATQLHAGEDSTLDTCLKVVERESQRFQNYRIEDHLTVLHEKLGTISWESDTWLNDLVSSFSVDVPLLAWERYVHDACQTLEYKSTTESAAEEEDAANEQAAVAITSQVPPNSRNGSLTTDASGGQGFILEAIRKMPYYLAFQLWDGQLHFLTSTALRLLLYEADMKVEALARITPSLRLTWPNKVCVNPHTKSRYSFLSHLPIGSSVVLHEVELRPYLSRRTVAVFGDYLRGQRRKIAAQQECRSRKDELYHEYVQQKSFYGDPR